MADIKSANAIKLHDLLYYRILFLSIEKRDIFHFFGTI